MRKRPHNVRPDGHLQYPSQFVRKLDPHKELDRFFIRTDDGRPALDVLHELNARTGIGGAPPYLTIRKAADDRGEMIVIGDSQGGEKSTGVSAAGLTLAQAKLHPTARAELEVFAEEKLLRLMARNAPATVRYTRILRWWLSKVAPKPTTPERDERRRRTNKKRDVRDPGEVFDEHEAHVKVLMRFFRDRRLEDHGDDIGDEFAKWFRDELRAAGKPEVGGQPEGGQDATIASYQYRLAKALQRFGKRFQAPVKLHFKRTYAKTNKKQKLATGYSGAEVLRLMLFCLGYIWNADGFAWEWSERCGRPYQRLLRLHGDALEAHLAYYLPVLRLIVIYVLTGTRLARIASMGWESDDYRACIDFDRNLIIRNGDEAPDYPNKPRNPSRMLPITRRLLRHFLAEDERQQSRERWDDLDVGGFHVVHDGCGGEVSNLEYRAKKAREAVGIRHTNHQMKSAGVGLFWEVGFDLRRIARLTGNDPDTLEASYLFLVEESEGVLRTPPDVKTLTFLKFVDPDKRHRRAPRASRPGLPPPIEKPVKSTRAV